MSTNDPTTLHITVGAGDALRDQARRQFEAAARGADMDEMEPVLNFESLADFARLMTEANIELLRAIAQHEPASIRETAQLVDRGYKEVHTNLTTLESLDVIKFEQGGRAKRPVVLFDELEIKIVISGDSPEPRTE